MGSEHINKIELRVHCWVFTFCFQMKEISVLAGTRTVLVAAAVEAEAVAAAVLAAAGHTRPGPGQATPSVRLVDQPPENSTAARGSSLFSSIFLEGGHCIPDCQNTSHIGGACSVSFATTTISAAELLPPPICTMGLTISCAACLKRHWPKW